jgi:hypothetical protein
MNTHAFTPSHPDGVVCVAVRELERFGDIQRREVCGYPAGHPIHAAAPAPTLAERFEETRAKAVDRDDARQALAELRETLPIIHATDAAPLLALLDRIERAL